MKNLILIVPANRKEALADALRESPEVTGFVLTSVEGHGAQTAHDAVLSARDRVAGYVPRVRVDLVLEAAAVQTLLNRLQRSAGFAGRCVYWVTDAEGFGRL